MALFKESMNNLIKPSSSSLRRILTYGVSISMILSVLIMVIACPSCLSDSDTAITHLVVNMIYGLSLFFGMSYLNSYLGKRMQWLKKPWKAFGIVMVANILCVVSIVAVANIIWRYVFLDMNPSTAIKHISIQEFIIPMFIGLLITSIFQGAAFLKTWKTSLLETEHFKQAQLTAKYETLNSQVNPHFLFNSLNVLSSLVKKDPTKAETFIHHLSDIYRNILDLRKEELIPLSKELETLDAYKFLLETRYENRLIVDCKLPKADNIFIVPLSLQMLLENAVKHNASTKKDPLRIRIFMEGKTVWIVNNKRVLNETVPGKKMGLENIRERYQLATGQAIQVIDTSEEFKVGLPLIID